MSRNEINSVSYDGELGQHRGIAVPFTRLGQQEAFGQAVIQKACENMKGEIPSHMVEQKLDAITAQTKIGINNDVVYHLLSDMLEVLEEAYKGGGSRASDGAGA